MPTLPAFAAALAIALGAPAMAAPEGLSQAASVPAEQSAPAPATVPAASQPPAGQPAASTASQAPAAGPAAPAVTQPPAVQPPAPAATIPARPAPAPVVMPATPAAGSLLQTTLALVFVLALLAGIAWFLKRFGPRAAGGSANLRVVGALSLGGRERIMVVEVGDQWIVVGASPGRVNALATMPKQAGAETAALLAPHATPAASFADWLKQTLDKRNAK